MHIEEKELIKNNNINDEELKKQSEAIRRGTAYIDRLSLAEEFGRTAGTRTNVEASLLSRADERANSQEPRNVKKQKQEAILEQYAKRHGLWMDEKDLGEKIEEGNEAVVYPSPVPGHVRKVINYQSNSKTPADFLDNRISLYNYLFPDTAYTLVGFTRSDEFHTPNAFSFVVDQPFVQGRHLDLTNEADFNLLKKEAEKRGFQFKVENFKPKFINKNYTVEDLHEKNVMITAENNLRFIDPITELNTDHTAYGDGTVKFLNNDSQYANDTQRLEALQKAVIHKTMAEVGNKDLATYYARYIANHFEDIKNRLAGGILIDQDSPSFNTVLAEVKHGKEAID